MNAEQEQGRPQGIAACGLLLAADYGPADEDSIAVIREHAELHTVQVDEPHLSLLGAEGWSREQLLPDGLETHCAYALSKDRRRLVAMILIASRFLGEAPYELTLQGTVCYQFEQPLEASVETMRQYLARFASGDSWPQLAASADQALRAQGLPNVFSLLKADRLTR